MSSVIVSCKEIVKTFHTGEAEVKALQGITLDIYENELLMLVGPSGCGKTTFVSVLSGLLNFESGVCEVMGEDISVMSDDVLTAFRGENIGFVFQAFNLLSSLSAIENVALPLTVKKYKREEALKRSKEMLEAVGLGGKEDIKPSGLSGGEQQRVAIARALIHNPKFIICDEPTSSLDHKSGQVVMELLRKIIKEKGASMIVVTHDNRIYKYADRIVHMEDGKIIKVAS
ncbi:Methionine ABC transporter ATP-binding protein [hydrothermal vent metagenome]|uniref:Methionine ABC transporter ATP-binding protein n=1 Tax=hydrothermal vent metagenome TaxID=652676 RepID=A0A1W1D263_9ZZZZ